MQRIPQDRDGFCKHVLLFKPLVKAAKRVFLQAGDVCVCVGGYD